MGELNETFNVTLTAPVNATLADGLGIGTIRNDDPPSLAISDVSVAEGNAGTVSAVFTVTRTLTTGATSVSFVTSNGTATAGSDYVAATGTVSFGVGEATKTITIVVNGDTVVEPDETFNVTMTAPTNANFVDALGVGTIANDDFLFVSIGDVSVVEGNAGTVNAVFTVTRSFAVGTSTVRFATGGGTAAAGIDYVAATGTVSFGVGETSKTVTVAVTGDTAVEPDETFDVTLSTATGTTIADGLGVGTITNDDVTPPVVQGKRALVLTTTADKARSKTESKNGYTITITNPNAGAVTVTKVVVCLPQRFLYRSRSTTKAITANPSRTRCGLAGKARPAPQKLTWNVSLVVPARGSVSFHFAINVGSKVGTFKNAVTGVAADGYIVTATGPTAPVKVVKPPKLREVVRR